MAFDGGDDAGVCESWGGRDDGVCDEVVNALQRRYLLAMQNLEQKEAGEGKRNGVLYRMLFLLHLLHSAIFKGPLDNVGLMRDTLDVMALFEFCPEVV